MYYVTYENNGNAMPSMTHHTPSPALAINDTMLKVANWLTAVVGAPPAQTVASVPPDPLELHKPLQPDDATAALSVHVANIDYAVSATALLRHFRGCGNIVRATVRRNKVDGRPLGFGYVELELPCDVQMCLRMDGTQLYGRVIRVRPKRVPQSTAVGGRLSLSPPAPPQPLRMAPSLNVNSAEQSAAPGDRGGYVDDVWLRASQTSSSLTLASSLSSSSSLASHKSKALRPAANSTALLDCSAAALLSLGLADCRLDGGETNQQQHRHQSIVRSMQHIVGNALDRYEDQQQQQQHVDEVRLPRPVILSHYENPDMPLVKLFFRSQQSGGVF